MIPFSGMLVNGKGKRRPIWLKAAPLGLLLCALAGCASHPDGTAAPLENSKISIESIRIICVPVAINLDQRLGADGFGVKVFGINSKDPKFIAIREGTLVIKMFDGILKGGEPFDMQPLRTWTYPAEALNSHMFTSRLGVSYRFAPRWEASKPTQPKVTIQVVYISPAGKAIYSESSLISMLAH